MVENIFTLLTAYCYKADLSLKVSFYFATSITPIGLHRWVVNTHYQTLVMGEKESALPLTSM